MKVGLNSNFHSVIVAKDYELDFVPFNRLVLEDGGIIVQVQNLTYNYANRRFIGLDTNMGMHQEAKNEIYDLLRANGYIDVGEVIDGDLRTKTEAQIDVLMDNKKFNDFLDEFGVIDYQEIIKHLIVAYEEGGKHRCSRIYLAEKDILPYTRYLLSNPVACQEDFYNALLLGKNIVEACEELGKDVIFMGRTLIFGGAIRKAGGEVVGGSD